MSDGEDKDLYQIEIIFFEHNEQQRFAAEQWPQFVGKLDTRKAVVPTEPATQKQLLNDAAVAIKKSKTQRYIQQISWTQPLVDYVRSTPIHLQAGSNNEEIEGVLSVKPARNIYNVNVDLIFKANNQEFRLTRDIKVKKNEIFYLDHPVFGVMVVLSPCS